jgi:hypothetical protein
MRVEIIEDAFHLNTSKLIVNALDPENKMKYKRVGKISVNNEIKAIRLFQSKIDSSYVTVQKTYDGEIKAIYGLNIIEHVDLIKALIKESKKVYGCGDYCEIYLDVCSNETPTVWISGPDGGLFKPTIPISRIKKMAEADDDSEFFEIIAQDFSLDLPVKHDLIIEGEHSPEYPKYPNYLFICNSNVIDF